MATAEHTRLITAAARAALKPLGCTQKGRSRIWLDDQGWWLGVVEFQPSSWNRGSYLNVGACWLWNEKDYLSFDAGYRLAPFQPFTNAEDFAQAAQALAERAAAEVLALRERFPTPAHVHGWIATNSSAPLWSSYHAAVSLGLAGDSERSRQMFAEVIADTHDTEWAIALRQRCVALVQLLQTPGEFAAEVAAGVQRTRRLLGLPAWAGEAFESAGDR